MHFLFHYAYYVKLLSYFIMITDSHSLLDDYFHDLLKNEIK